MKCTAIFRILLLIASSIGISFGASTGDLRAGAAKVDITPPVDGGLYNVWGTHFTSVHDPTYVRAIVAGNGNDTVAIVAIDTPGNNVAAEMLEQIQKTSGIPAQNVVLVSTHDHNTAAISRDAAGGRANRPAAPGANAYVDKVIAAVASAVSQAKAAMQPALMSVGTGAVDININRDEYQPSGWKLGNNASGPSDKSVWVIRFEMLSGEPIALFVNYAVHSVVLGPDNTAITGDLSGAMSRWVERRYGNKMVALWTSGPAGDQNPKYMSWGMSWGPGYTERTTEPGFPLNDALGMLLGEEVVRISENMTAKTSKVSLWSAQEDSPVRPRRTPRQQTQ
jgi:neutral ceramidase